MFASHYVSTNPEHTDEQRAEVVAMRCRAMLDSYAHDVNALRALGVSPGLDTLREINEIRAELKRALEVCPWALN